MGIRKDEAWNEICKKCGRLLVSGASFCSTCGSAYHGGDDDDDKDTF